ncbi:MAG: hypothetical protein CMJ94_01035 [Planctomycetes bacterium]|nr:hypothetical protein [Planctomycetota bacterium]
MPDSKTFKAGDVVTTRRLRTTSSNPTRTAASLVREGVLTKVQGGLYYAPRRTRWGEAPPTAEALLTAWLDGQQNQDWLLTGSAVWNTLGLGSTAVQVRPWVYNRKRSGAFNLAGHALLLRRVPFPPRPPVEWFVVDLLNHYREAAADLTELQQRLAQALADHRFDPQRLREQANDYGRKWTQQVVDQAIAASRDAGCHHSSR